MTSIITRSNINTDVTREIMNSSDAAANKFNDFITAANMPLEIMARDNEICRYLASPDESGEKVCGGFHKRHFCCVKRIER